MCHNQSECVGRGEDRTGAGRHRATANIGLGLALSSTLLAGVAHAQSQPLRQADDPGDQRSKDFASDAAEALIRGDEAQALAKSDQAVGADDRSPWAHYDRVVALGALGRVDDAVVEYRKAEARFSPADIWGRSVAIYGRGNLLKNHGRCDEARASFREYIAFVGDSDPRDISQAEKSIEACQVASSGGAQPGSTTP